MAFRGSTGKYLSENASLMQSTEAGMRAGQGLSQQDFLIHDTCVTVNEKDEIQGALSKKECHQFIPGSPDGHLHRAFSVFLFNSDNKLLLQQRASDKITFPDVRPVLPVFVCAMGLKAQVRWACMDSVFCAHSLS